MFENFFEIDLGKYFSHSLKNKVLAVLYLANLELKNSYTRVELFENIFENVKELLNQLKAQNPKWKRRIENPTVVSQFEEIIERILKQAS